MRIIIIWDKLKSFSNNKYHQVENFHLAFDPLCRKMEVGNSRVLLLKYFTYLINFKQRLHNEYKLSEQSN